MVRYLFLVLFLYFTTISSYSSALSEVEKAVDHFALPGAVTYVSSDFLNHLHFANFSYPTQCFIGYSLGVSLALAKEVTDHYYDKGRFSLPDLSLGVLGSTLALLIYYPLHKKQFSPQTSLKVSLFRVELTQKF